MPTSDYLRHLRRKQTAAPLPTTPDKCHCTTLQNAHFFSSAWRYVAFLQTLVAVKRPGCGLALVALKKNRLWCVANWNVRQAMLQQMFQVTTFCTDTCFQSFLPLINCIVHHALLKFRPCRNKTDKLWKRLVVTGHVMRCCSLEPITIRRPTWLTTLNLVC